MQANARSGSRPDRTALRTRIRGLYAITPDGLDESTLLARCAAVLRGGAQVLQFRSKQGDPASRLALAQQLGALAHRYGAMFIVNDDAELAQRCAADGVHLGREDARPAEVLRLYPGLLVGVSCYDNLDLACEACASGADYLAFGAVAPSPTKPQAVAAPLSLFAAARPLELPLVAIGGIHTGNAATIHASGADALAVISAVFEHQDPETSARALASLYRTRDVP